jgi:hypothetical protein
MANGIANEHREKDLSHSGRNIIGKENKCQIIHLWPDYGKKDK